MGKKAERKSESWKPAVIQDVGSISKNKKRKEKRLSKSLIAANLNTSEASEVKKALGPLNKIKEDTNLNLKLTQKGKKENLFLSTSLPIKSDNKLKVGDGKSFPLTQSLKHAKNSRRMSEMLSSSTVSKINKKTPKKGKANVEEFIDSEAEEGEEPIDSKQVKPYEKGSKKKSKDESSDNESVNSIEDFLDMEASEGEETDNEDSDDAENDSDKDDSDENTDSDMSDFIVGDKDGDGSRSSDDDEDENPLNVTKSEPMQKKKIVKNEKENIPTEKLPNTKEKKAEGNNTANQTEGKIKTKNVKKTKEDKSQIMNGDTNVIQSKYVKKPTKFVGFVRGIPEQVSKKQLKGALCTKTDASKIVQIEIKKHKLNKSKNNYLIYVVDEDSLEDLLNHNFKAGDIEFTVYKARESTRIKEGKPIAFLPRVPLSITDDQLKIMVENETSKDTVLSIKSKRVNNKFQNRNIIIQMSDIESLKKIIQKGVCTVNGTSVVVREAFEAGLQLPTYKAVFSSIPSQTSEPVLKKAIESKVGKGSVSIITFSSRNDSFAFVSFKSEEAQKKALDPNHGIAINGIKLQSSEFKPRHIKKRSPPNEHAKVKKAEKRKNEKQKLKDDASSPKKMIQNGTNIKSTTNLKKAIDSNSPSGKGKQNNEKKKSKKVKHFQHESTKVQNKDKKKVLSEKIREKKKNLKEKKNKNKKSLNTSE